MASDLDGIAPAAEISELRARLAAAEARTENAIGILSEVRMDACGWYLKGGETREQPTGDRLSPVQAEAWLAEAAVTTEKEGLPGPRDIDATAEDANGELDIEEFAPWLLEGSK